MGQIQQVFDWAQESVDKESRDADASSRTDVQCNRQSMVPQAADEPDAEIASSPTCRGGTARADERLLTVGQPLSEAVAGPCVSGDAYEPAHPWHYLAAGDGAAPVPVTEIPPDEQVGRFLEAQLTKNPKKRLMSIRELLDQERDRLAADKQRYLDVIERGIGALSRYDREIAYTNSEIAVASTLALKYRHISLGLGRIAWLEEQIAIGARDKLFGDSK